MSLENEKLRKYTVNIPEEIALEIDGICKKRKMKQTQVIRMILDLGVSCHKDLDALGIIGVIDIGYYVKEAIKQASKGKQLRLPI